MNYSKFGVKNWFMLILKTNEGHYTLLIPMNSDEDVILIKISKNNSRLYIEADENRYKIIRWGILRKCLEKHSVDMGILGLFNGFKLLKEFCIEHREELLSTYDQHCNK